MSLTTNSTFDCSRAQTCRYVPEKAYGGSCYVLMHDVAPSLMFDEDYYGLVRIPTFKAYQPLTSSHL